MISALLSTIITLMIADNINTRGQHNTTSVLIQSNFNDDHASVPAKEKAASRKPCIKHTSYPIVNGINYKERKSQFKIT